MPAKIGALLVFLALLVACTSPSSSEGSGSPFASGSIEGMVSGTTDFQVSQTVRADSGAVSAILTYTGSCRLVVADLHLSYRQGGQVVRSGSDQAIRIGPLPPNKPYSHRFQGEHTFTPDGVVFVISNERCAGSLG